MQSLMIKPILMIDCTVMIIRVIMYYAFAVCWTLYSVLYTHFSFNLSNNPIKEVLLSHIVYKETEIERGWTQSYLSPKFVFLIILTYCLLKGTQEIIVPFPLFLLCQAHLYQNCWLLPLCPHSPCTSSASTIPWKIQYSFISHAFLSLPDPTLGSGGEQAESTCYSSELINYLESF